MRKIANRNSCRGENGQSGFTLIELMLAMIILAIGILAVIKLQMATGTGNLVSRNQTAAVNLARSKVEELRRVKEFYIDRKGEPTQDTGLLQNDGSDTDLDNWTSPDHQESSTIDEGFSSGGIFSLAWNIADGIPDVNMKTVRVRVSWNQGTEPKYVELETQIARKNLEYFQ